MCDAFEMQEVVVACDVQDERPDLATDRSREELAGSDGEVEQQVDSQPTLGIQEGRACRPIHAQTRSSGAAIVDRGANLAARIEARDELEPQSVQQRHQLAHALFRMRDDEVEIPRHALRAEDHERHAADERGRSTEVGERFDDDGEPVEVIVFPHEPGRGGYRPGSGPVNADTRRSSGRPPCKVTTDSMYVKLSAIR
jgi:hypothetical protein